MPVAPRRRTLTRVAIGVATAAGLTTSPASSQQVAVGAGSSLSLANAFVDLGCSDLVVSGTLNTDSATVARGAVGARPRTAEIQ